MPRILLVGCGNVGAGVGSAFAQQGWDCIVVDPSAELVPSSLREQPHEVHACAIEAVSDEQFRQWVVSCSTVCYAAECGNRDTYSTKPELSEENRRRFGAFAHRIVSAGGNHIAYIGGSWTRRQLDIGCGATPIVTDDSPAKPMKECNPYESAKNEAHDAAVALSASLGVCITFYDWASVVPNLAPNFTMGKMAIAALHDCSVSYSAGDFGRPLLGAVDAGRAMFLAEVGRLSATSEIAQGQARCEVRLLPGSFTPFSEFAAIACEEAAAARVARGDAAREVSLVGQEGNTPAFLSARCESANLRGLGFEPSVPAVHEGLRETCKAALRESEA